MSQASGRARRVRSWIFLSGVGLALLLVPILAAGVVNCYVYPNSTSTSFFPGYGYVCAYTGYGCAECVDSDTGGSCTTDIVSDGGECDVLPPRPDIRN